MTTKIVIISLIVVAYVSMDQALNCNECADKSDVNCKSLVETACPPEAKTCVVGGVYDAAGKLIQPRVGCTIVPPRKIECGFQVKGNVIEVGCLCSKDLCNDNAAFKKALKEVEQAVKEKKTTDAAKAGDQELKCYECAEFDGYNCKSMVAKTCLPHEISCVVSVSVNAAGEYVGLLGCTDVSPGDKECDHTFQGGFLTAGCVCSRDLCNNETAIKTAGEEFKKALEQKPEGTEDARAASPADVKRVKNEGNNMGMSSIVSLVVVWYVLKSFV